MKRFFLMMLSVFTVLNIVLFSELTFAQMDQMKGMAGGKMPMPAPGNNTPEGQVPVMLTPHKQKLVGVKTQPVRQKTMNKLIRAIGRVAYNERTLTTVTTKIEGWIEDLTIDATGMAVKKGKALFSVYSPKLLQTQEEYLLAISSAKKMNNKMGSGVMAQASRKRLLLWDVKPAQIQRLEKRGEVIRALPVLSPASGIVTEKMALNGMYVKPGMALYKIADLSQVWVLVDIYEHELPWIKTGQMAELTLTSLPGEFFKGKITYIYPYLNEESRTATIRIELDNKKGQFKPGMYANVALSIEAAEGLLVPESAVLDSGLRQVAFVRQAGGRFEPRVITIGLRLNNEVQVLSGLAEGEAVVTHGTFLIDSESKLMASMEGMMGLVGMGDWKMEGSKMGGMEGMDMGGMNMDDKKMDGMDMNRGDQKIDGMPMGQSPPMKMKEMNMKDMPEQKK
ncbi:Probable Co/Zn/Cd efflux system membrane fusion protein [hydrothermal vent metagenome]|uniref:Probable Co/Zn/Cd efflux system membrane fusion protein n=1 Tax=hydrothermal vent metagenome TaxID=652676 RepID=A0A3B1D2X8_9ZZZZ